MPATDAGPSRETLRGHRRQAMRAALAVVLAVVGIGWLLGAPGDLASVRLAGVAVAWWGAGAGQALALFALTLRPR